MAAAPTIERLAVPGDGGRPSHLAVRYDRPAEARPQAGVCLLYLHGFGSRQDGEKADFFRRQSLAAGLAFASFDFAGHGASGGDMLGLTLSRNLADVERVVSWLAERGECHIVLLGSSMGGGTAMWFSALHPERVVAGLHLAPALELERGLLAWAGPQRARQWEETGTLRYSHGGITCDLGWQLIQDLRAHRVGELLLAYRTPTLILQGMQDASVPWRGAVDFAAHSTYREIELHLFADGDHRLLDRLDVLWSLMRQFLAGRHLW